MQARRFTGFVTRARRAALVWACAAAFAALPSSRALPEACTNPKSAAFDFVFGDSNDEALRHVVAASPSVATNELTGVQFSIVTDTTFTTTVGRIVFRAPASAQSLVAGTLDIATGTVKGENGAFEMLTVGFGPLQEDGTTQCANRISMTDEDPALVKPDAAFAANTFDVKDFGPDVGTAAFVAKIPIADGKQRTFNVRFKGKFRSGALYELFVAGVYRAGIAASPDVSADLLATFAGGSPAPDPVVVEPDQVKIQPQTRQGNCGLTSMEHLLLAIRIEQAVKLRIDRRSKELLDAIDRVGNSGANPGPALRALDQLVAAVRKDVRAELRDAVRGGLEYSKRHLACAKERLPDTGLSEGQQAAAATEIDQAIVDDDDAITASQTENTDIASEAVRLQGTLMNTSQRLSLALFNKQQAGEILDPGFMMPDFSSVDPADAFDEFQRQVAAMADQVLEKLEAQRTIIKDNDRKAAVDAILAVQQPECIAQFFDEVSHQYEQVHTLVRERLAEIKAAADAAAASPEPVPGAPTPKQGKQAEKDMRAVDRSYDAVVRAVETTETKTSSAFGGLVGTEQERTDRKIRALQNLLLRAELAGDRAWRRLIRKELKKFVGFYAQGI